MKASSRGRRGVTTGDTLIGLALVAVVVALAYPTLRARSFTRTLNNASARVDAIVTAAVRRHRDSGAWPEPAPPGEPPEELRGMIPDELGFRADDYLLEWSRWDVVDYIEIPPTVAESAVDAPPDTVAPERRPTVRTVGGVLLHSGDVRLLGELLGRYRDRGAFVRDTVWTLVLSGSDGG